MYVTEVRIENVRSIGSVHWEVAESRADGWHVILGDNGSGKSSFLRSIALALIGPRDAASLRMSWESWLRRDSDTGQIRLAVTRDETFDPLLGRGNAPRPPIRCGVKFRRITHGPEILTSRSMGGLGPSIGAVELDASVAGGDPSRHVWGTGPGWFCAAFGPYRRLTGGDPESVRISAQLPKLARYLSIFDERYTLIDCIDWLKRLKFVQLERAYESHTDGSSGNVLLDAIIGFVNQPGFLPHQAELRDITSKSVEFVDGNGMAVAIEDLSDGYRSILSLTFELIRQMALAYGPDRVFDADDPTKVVCPGVVLIDEIDVHLHPAWQRQIGLFLRQHFPKIQFIVTTHSPLICQAADVGTVFRLPKPGETDGGGMIRGAKLDRLLYGNVLDAYGTEAFGANVGRSEESKRRRRRLAELNVKETREGLSRAESQEQEGLRGALPTAALARDASHDPDS
jgi:hypothetical protein